MLSRESSAPVLFPQFLHGDKLHPALPVPHVPEVRLASLKLRLRPRHPDPVVMHVIAGNVVGDEFTRRRVNGMEVSAATKGLLDIGPGKFTGLSLVAEHFAVTDSKNDLLSLALRCDCCLGRRGARMKNGSQRCDRGNDAWKG